MRVTAKVDYALRAALELAAAAGGPPIKGEALADSQGIPLKYLENILLDLRRGGIVSSMRGAEGGYWLARPPDEVTVADIIRAVEGPLANVRGERPETLDHGGAATYVRELWVATRASLRVVLEGTTLADLVAGELPEAAQQLLEDDEAWVSH